MARTPEDIFGGSLSSAQQVAVDALERLLDSRLDEYKGMNPGTVYFITEGRGFDEYLEQWPFRVELEKRYRGWNLDFSKIGVIYFAPARVVLASGIDSDALHGFTGLGY